MEDKSAIDMITLIERSTDIKLTPYQKQYVKFLESLPKNSKIIALRGGRTIVVPAPIEKEK